jgi:CDP-diacylglycerol--glycerol-3-phosphate 3-phosphatidyltransferase
VNGDSKDRSDRLVTLPNVLSLFRVLAAPGLVMLAARDQRLGVVVMFLAMAASDWIDGKLAILLDQRSNIGPRLDSVADIMMYGGLLISALVLDRDRLAAEWPWIAAPIAAYLAAGSLSLARFGRWPQHHTRTAKISWGLMLVGAVAFLSDWSLWPLRVGLISATLASVQSVLITRTLTEWREDVPSVSAARRMRDTGR